MGEIHSYTSDQKDETHSSFDPGLPLFLSKFNRKNQIVIQLLLQHAYIVVQPTGTSTGPETIVTGAPPFIEPIRSLLEPLPAWFCTCIE